VNKNCGNSRNVRTLKSLKSVNGEIEITLPRDTHWEFDPIAAEYLRQIGY